MKKYFFILMAALIACTVAIAQTSGSKRPKKKKQITEKVVKKDNSKRNQSGKKPKAPKKQYSEEPRVSSSYTPEVRTYYANGVSFQMVEVRGGTFTMGATAEQGNDVLYLEKPTHQVTLSSYSIGKTEVTQELWEAVMGSNPSFFKGSNLPVEQVSCEDCKTFIRKLNALTGKNFRLPTEAEWEFAARGGINSRGYKYSGSNTIDDVAWYEDNSSSTTHPVATKAPNELGIYDMSGNVYEWCNDWCGDYTSASQTNPTGANPNTRPGNSWARVLRGGSWYNYAWFCRVSYRGRTDTTLGCNYFGLRLAL